MGLRITLIGGKPGRQCTLYLFPIKGTNICFKSAHNGLIVWKTVKKVKERNFVISTKRKIMVGVWNMMEEYEMMV